MIDLNGRSSIWRLIELIVVRTTHGGAAPVGNPTNGAVKYIMIGGFAVNLHTFSRAANDIDVWCKDEINNRKALGKVLEQFGYSELSFEDLDFIPGWTDFYIGAGIRLDIIATMVGLKNISFDEALNNVQPPHRYSM